MRSRVPKPHTTGKQKSKLKISMSMPLKKRMIIEECEKQQREKEEKENRDCESNLVPLLDSLDDLDAAQTLLNMSEYLFCIIIKFDHFDIIR